MHGQQPGEQVPGGGRVPRLPGPAGELSRTVRVSGCSGPRTRSSTGTSPASRSRAAAASPSSPVNLARFLADGQDVRVLRAEYPFPWQQPGEQVPGRGQIPCLPGQPSEIVLGRPGCSGAPGRGPASARAAARRAGPGRRPDPRLARSSRRDCGGRPGYPGAPGRGPASSTGSSPASRSRAAAGSPARPVELARLPRAIRVRGCSTPRTRSRASSTLRSILGLRRNCRSIRGNWQSGPSRRCHSQERPGRAAAAPRIPATSRARWYRQGLRPRSGWQRLPPVLGQFSWHLIGGDGLDQSVHRH